METESHRNTSLSGNEQMAKYRMSQDELRKTLHIESKENCIILFGQRISNCRRTDEEIDNKPRFRNEIAALKAFFRSQARAYSMDRLIPHENLAKKTKRSAEDTVKIGKSKRYVTDYPKTDSIIDAVDIGNRLEKMEQDKLQLLIEYYIENIPAKIIARKYNYELPQCGGKISAARRALRKVLGELIIPEKKSQLKTSEIGETKRLSDHEIRKRKAIRFVQKKLATERMRKLNE